eukprot:757623-Hanusia_phi.AAC.5
MEGGGITRRGTGRHPVISWWHTRKIKGGPNVYAFQSNAVVTVIPCGKRRDAFRTSADLRSSRMVASTRLEEDAAFLLTFHAAAAGSILTWGDGTNEMGTIPGIQGCEQGPPCDCDCDSVFNQFGNEPKCSKC